MTVTGLHPVIRIITLLVFIAGVSTARPELLLAGGVIFTAIFAMAGFPATAKLLGMIYRLRWLLLAILIVYGWWTPGDKLFPAAGALSPSVQGMEYGMHRITVLILIVCAVHLLVRTTTTSGLMSALMLLTSPLLNEKLRERFAVRLLLTAGAVGTTREMLGQATKQGKPSGQGLAGIDTRVREFYHAVLERAERSAGQPIELDRPDMPPLYQWLIPLLLAVLIGLLLAV
jgi:energy-coupling factor transport system permease protein